MSSGCVGVPPPHIQGGMKGRDFCNIMVTIMSMYFLKAYINSFQCWM